MSRLDDYRSALLVAFPEAGDTELIKMLDARGSQFASFIIDHGLGPLWHERTGRNEFLDCRRAAEALYLAQEQALREIDAVLEGAGIEYAFFKGAANRLQLYGNPALRACYDIDLLVRPEDRVQAATVLVEDGFNVNPEWHGISRGIVLTKAVIDIDLHWGLLREGRLREDPTTSMLARCRRLNEVSVLAAEDALFCLLVHPAFAKHMASWGMGLHRVADILLWLDTQYFDWKAVYEQLERNGVRTAAWATLRWVELLSGAHSPSDLHVMLADLRPGRLRSAWLDFWLREDLSERSSESRWVSLIGFTSFLHDMPRDCSRALFGRVRAHRRCRDDISAFRELLD